jgi:hypothetical protein
LAAIKVDQHDSIWLEKVCEYMVGKSNQQKGQHLQLMYETTVGWVIVVSIPICLGNQAGTRLVGSNTSAPASFYTNKEGV